MPLKFIKTRTLLSSASNVGKNTDAGSKRRESNVYIWFRGKDVASVLGYANTIQALTKNVDDDDKKKMEELGKLSDSPLDANAQNSIFINESGVYFLILRSEKPEAKTFK